MGTAPLAGAERGVMDSVNKFEEQLEKIIEVAQDASYQLAQGNEIYEQVSALDQLAFELRRDVHLADSQSEPPPTPW
jgi:hypothetical protein